MGQGWIEDLLEIARGETITTRKKKYVDDNKTLKAHGEKVRVPCLSVKTQGLPYGVGEYLAVAGDWWGRQVADVAAIFRKRQESPADSVRFKEVNGALVEQPEPFEVRPRIKGDLGAPKGGFQVELPGWDDLVVFNNEKVFKDETRKEQFASWIRQLKNSPTPPGQQELARVLTQIDDVQDIMATAGVLLMVAEKASGRVVPGLGAVVTASDALNLFYSALSLDPKLGQRASQFHPKSGGSQKLLHWRESPAGKGHKRNLAAKAGVTLGGQKARLEELRNTGKLKIGVGDVLQGLQATTTLFGSGIQLGAYMGYAQDAFWGLARGATWELPSRVFDPVGLERSGADACYRSPRLSEVGSTAYRVLANNALFSWSRIARVAPWLPYMDEAALRSVLLGMRLNELILRPWLESGVWVEPLSESISAGPITYGLSESFALAGRPASEVMQAGSSVIGQAVVDAIQNVPDWGRQAFYHSLAVSITWGLWGSLEPAGVLAELDLDGPAGDAVVLAEAGIWPERDLF